MSDFSYDKTLKIFSRANRRNQTNAEKKLWIHLRNSIQGYKFRRQFPIDNFILDFYCIKKKLAIELDGSQHQINKTYDTYRTNKLALRGITVIRFWDNDVIKKINSVLEKINSELESGK